MENISNKPSYRTNPHYGPSAKSVYDDVFGGPPRFGVPSLSPRTEDYAEIFGGIRGSRCATSIPVLDLPAADVAEVPASFRGSHFDYLEVFGRSDGLDFVVFEELVKKVKGGSYDSSDEAWTPAQSETMSDESETFACSDRYQSMSSIEFHHPSDGIKQFKVSYNKVFHTSEDDVANGVAHVTQLNNVPGYSLLVTAAPPPQKMVVTNNLKHEDFSGGLGEGKRLKKTTSCPNKPFVTVSDISLRTQPSHLPPPSRPPPVLSLKDGDRNTRSSKIKASRSFAFRETTSDDDSPLYYDVEVDASSSAAVSAAAMKDVMKKAQAKLKSAKHMKERSKQAKICGETSERDSGGIKGVTDNAIKHGEKYGLLQESPCENKGNVEWKQNEEFYEVVETDDSRKLFDMGDDQRFVVQNLRDTEHGRETRGSQTIWHQEEVNRKMRSDSEIREKIIVEAVEGEDFDNMAKVRKKENEEERKHEDDFVLEEHGIRLRENEREVYDKKLKEAMETAKIEKRLKETLEREEKEKKEREAWEREEKEKRDIEASERELEEKRLREAKEENEKQFRLASEEKEQMEAREREEIDKRENVARERELEEKRLQEAIEKQEGENRLRLALEEKEKKQREAREREEKEKREKEAHEKEEKEKREKEALEIEEKEKREKEAREREVEERRLGKVLEEEAKKQKEREEKEKQEKEAHERELEEKRLREAIEQEEKEKKLKMALEKEENEKKQNLACERDEAEKRLKDDLRLQNIEGPNCSLQRGENKEKVKEGCELEEDTQEKEVNEREYNEKRSKEAFENEEIDRMWEEDNRLDENVALCGAANKVDKNCREPKKTKGSQVGDFSSSGVARDGLEHKKSEIRVGGAKESLHVRDTVFEFDKKQSKNAANFAKLNKYDLGERDTNPRKVQVGKDKKEEKFTPSKEVKEKVQSQNAERKGKNLDDVLAREEKEREERLNREKELENERLRKIEEEREREREREKDRMAVDMASLERAAVERATADTRQRALAEARERSEKSNAEARLRAERAAVERATAEARERAFQKAKADNATVETRERFERMRQSSSRSDSWQGVGSTNGSMNAYSSVHGGVEVESAQRCKARLERHQRTAQRAAKALEEKNMRDLLAQRELAERNRLAEGLDVEVKRWSSGKEGNLRALLSTLQYILGPDSGWQPIPLTEVITSAAVKRAYRKATLCVHPDKLQQRGAGIQQKYVCEKVFDLLKAAWNKFNSEER